MSLIKKHLQLFLVQGWNVAISSRRANQIPFQSLFFLNEVLHVVFLCYSFLGLGVSCSVEELKMLTVVEGVFICGIEWAVNFCQELRCVWQCVCGRETGGVGARQGLTWSKTQMQSHIGKVREREKSHAGLPTHPPLPPLFCPFSHNNSHGRDEPWLNRGFPCTPPPPLTPIDLQQQKWEKQTPSSDCTCQCTWPMDVCTHRDSRF